MKKYSMGAIIILIALISFNIIFGIGTSPLTDPDEPVYAETAREMIVFKDYLSPRIFNEVWFDKPPMYYWLVAGCFNLFGISEFSARFPAALMAIGTVLMVYFSATKLFNERAGFLSAMILGTSVMVFYMGKASVTDTTLLFFLTSALLAFLHEKYWLMYICMGFATLTKGPIGIVFPGTIIFLYLLATRDLRKILQMHVIPGIILTLLVAGPWYYLMYQAHGMDFINTFLGFHNITRFTTPEHPTRVTWYYYIPVVMVGVFPWTGLLIQSIKATISKSVSKDFSKLVFMQIWWIFVFVFFTITKTKLVSYTLPLFPALAIMIGWNIDRMMQEEKGQYQSWGIASGITFLLMAIGFYVGGLYLPEITFISTMLAVITFIIGIAIMIALLYYKDAVLGAWLHIASGIVTMIVLTTFVMPLISDRFSVKSIALETVDTLKSGKVIYVDKFLRPGFMFYTETLSNELDSKSQESITAMLKDANPKYIVMRNLMYNNNQAEFIKYNWNIVRQNDFITVYETN